MLPNTVFSVVGVPAMLTTGITVEVAKFAPILVNSVILIVVIFIS
jgi:hypothetical protein